MGVVGDFPLKTESLRIMDVAVEDAFAVSVLIGVSLILGLVTVKDVKGAFLGRVPSCFETCTTNVASLPATPICILPPRRIEYILTRSRVDRPVLGPCGSINLDFGQVKERPG